MPTTGPRKVLLVSKLTLQTAFDLFDADQRGSIDMKGTPPFMLELKAAMISLGF
jgi:hypothetical protein